MLGDDGPRRARARGRGRRRRTRDRGARRRAPATCCGARRGAAADDIVAASDTVAEPPASQPRGSGRRSGSCRTARSRGARRVGIATVLWTTWGRDWRKEATPDTVVADVMRRYVDGGTVLLHDSDCTSYPGSWRSALGALPIARRRARRAASSRSAVGDHGIRARRRRRSVSDLDDRDPARGPRGLRVRARVGAPAAGRATARTASSRLRWGLLGRLFRNPVWLVGGGVDVAAYVLEAASLGFGSIIVVQPLLVCGLLWALPLATIGRPERVTLPRVDPGDRARRRRSPPSCPSASPEGGRTDASILAWVLTAVGLLGADHPRGDRRARCATAPASAAARVRGRAAPTG